MQSLNDNELKALISLLDDNDPQVFDHIQERILTMGKDVIPLLEEVWSNSFDPVLQQRIENIVHKIQFDTLKAELIKWASENQDDLFSGIILIARYQYPDLDETKIREQLNKIKRDAWTSITKDMTPLQKIQELNHVLFETYAFNGNTSNFHAPQNSFINTVLESKRGNPLMLSAIYSIVARQLDMPVYGVNLPEHFVLAYQEKNLSPESYTYPQANVLFYINPFSRGTIFSKKDLDQFLKKLNLEPNKIFYEPCSNLEIIQRSLRNLSFSYQKLGDNDKLNEIEELMDALSF